MLLKLGLLIPQGWAGIGYVGTAIGGVLATVQFTNTVTTGSIITAAVVIVLSGLFTLRNNLRSFWHDLAVERGAQVEEQQTRIHDLEVEILKLHEATKDELAHHLDEQRILRHELKGEVAALKAALQVEQAKTDLSTLMEQLAGQHREAMTNISAGLLKQQQIIELLAGREDQNPT